MIKSSDLLNMLKDKLDKEEITQEDLDQVEDLTLKKYKVNGMKRDIDLAELSQFKNLKTLILSKFEISDGSVQAINENANLWAVQFSSCDLQTVVPINESVRYVIFDHCQNMNGGMINNNEVIKIIGAEIDMKQIANLSGIQQLYMQKCKIENIEELSRCGKLKYLNLDGSETDNRPFLNGLDKKIELSYNDEYFLTDNGER